MLVSIFSLFVPSSKSHVIIPFSSNLAYSFSWLIIEFANANRRNGIPDVIIFYKKKHARLETKRSKDASKRQLQEYYIEYFNKQGIYAAFLMPENKEEVFNELRRYFKV